MSQRGSYKLLEPSLCQLGPNITAARVQLGQTRQDPLKTPPRDYHYYFCNYYNWRYYYNLFHYSEGTQGDSSRTS
eukprot:12398733-Karenia_brevis.AAC.2